MLGEVCLGHCLREAYVLAAAIGSSGSLIWLWETPYGRRYLSTKRRHYGDTRIG
jgi:hypothetical protein